MKKICYIVTLPVTIKAFFIPQLEYLSNKGFEVSVICNDDFELRNELNNEIKFIPVDIPRGISFINSIKTIKKLVAIFKTEKYDLVQYSTPNAALYSAIAAKATKIKIRNYHCMGFRYLGFRNVTRKVFKLIEKLTCYLSTHIECVSKTNLELGVIEKLFSEDKVTVVFNGSTGGVDLKKFDINYREQWRTEVRKKYGIDEDDFVYGFVGRITRDKGINELLEAYFSLNTDAKLFLVGGIEENHKLNLDLLNKAIEDKNVIFVGNVTDVEKYYATMDVLILPSYREGFGNVIIEAGVMGTPAIVSNIPGPKDAIRDSETGLLVKVKNVKDLVDKMDEIRDNYVLKEYSNKSYSFVKDNFNSELLCEYIYKRKKELIENE
ncbi:glycosyltransferase family 4 protein [[Ruminococcus] lactaris]|uniref:glycosyltransferase family 4 protein n=1 Tax=[Ruminococcus] lactaris TaxID=46228 RepID=UPI0035220B9E